MANTNPSGVANTITDIKIPITAIIDEIFATEKKTLAWSPNPALVQGFNRAKTGQLSTIFTAPLQDYDRAQGYVAGAAGISWEDYTLRYDRGRSYVLDAVDMMQQDGVLTATAVIAETVRSQVIPEQESLAFASAYSNIPTANVKTKLLAVADIVDDIGDSLDNLRGITGIEEGYSIFVSSDARAVLRKSTQVQKTKDIGGYSGRLDLTANTFDGQPLTYVPAAWMKTVFDKDTTNGGVKPGTGVQDIQVLISAPNTVQNIVAHEITNIFGPGMPDGTSELVDGTRINTRIFYDTITPKNKRPGVGAIVKPVGP